MASSKDVQVSCFWGLGMLAQGGEAVSGADARGLWLVVAG